MREDREKRKERILEAAFQTFLEYGYAHTKMADIASRAGYGKSTLYEYFDSKDKIFEHLLRYKIVDCYRQMGPEAEKQSSAELKIRSFISAEIDMHLSYSKVVDMSSLMMNPELIINPLLIKMIGFVLRYRFDCISGWIREGLSSGEFYGVDSGIAAAAIIGASGSFGTGLVKLRCHPQGGHVWQHFFEPSGFDELGEYEPEDAAADSPVAMGYPNACNTEEIDENMGGAAKSRDIFQTTLLGNSDSPIEDAKDAFFDYIMAGLKQR
jgi:TetR/AcrR family fatty acid metabolism transcriptional regulator